MLYGESEAKCESLSREEPPEVELEYLKRRKECIKKDIRKLKQMRKHLFGMLNESISHRENDLANLIGNVTIKLDRTKTNLQSVKKNIKDCKIKIKNREKVKKTNKKILNSL